MCLTTVDIIKWRLRGWNFIVLLIRWSACFCHIRWNRIRTIGRARCPVKPYWRHPGYLTQWARIVWVSACLLFLSQLNKLLMDLLHTIVSIIRMNEPCYLLFTENKQLMSVWQLRRVSQKVAENPSTWVLSSAKCYDTARWHLSVSKKRVQYNCVILN